MQKRRLTSIGLITLGVALGGASVLGGGPGAQASGSHQTAPVVVVNTAIPTLQPVATATATATAVSVPLSAVPVGVLSLSAQRHNSFVVFHWRMAGQAQVLGFRLYAGKTLLTHRLIPVHAGLAYHHRVQWSGHGKLALGIVLTSGQHVTVGVR